MEQGALLKDKFHVRKATWDLKCPFEIGYQSDHGTSKDEVLVVDMIFVHKNIAYGARLENGV